GVIIPSLAEGYGLPLIEALGYLRPVLARDIEVFRVHEASGVRYFPEHASPQMLADSIQGWLNDISSGQVKVTDVQCVTWEDSVKVLLEVLEPLTLSPKPASAG